MKTVYIAILRRSAGSRCSIGMSVMCTVCSTASGSDHELPAIYSFDGYALGLDTSH